MSVKNLRKLIVVSVIIGLGTVLAFLRFIDGAQWVDLMKWIAAIYVVGNIGSAVADKVSISTIPKKEGEK